MAKNLRARLINEAVTVFAESGGVSDVNMRDLARRCEVSHAAPYRHFETPQALVRAVAEQGFEQLDVAYRAVVSEIQHLPAVERYVSLGLHYIDWAAENPGYYFAMAESGPLDHRVTGSAAWPGALQHQFELVTEAQAAGWRSDSPPEVVTLGGWIFAQGVVRMLLSGELDRLGDGRGLAMALMKDLANMPVTHGEGLRLVQRIRHPPRDDAPQALLDAAAELVAEQGLAAFTMDEAARRSGLPESAPEGVFVNREGMLRALAAEGYRLLDDYIARSHELAAGALNTGPAAADIVAAIARAYARFAENHPGHAGVVWRADLFPPGELPPPWERTDALLRTRTLCQQWIDGHDISGIDADTLAFGALAIAHGAVSLGLDGVVPPVLEDVDFPQLVSAAAAAAARSYQR